jgi:hypothetical protein
MDLSSPDNHLSSRSLGLGRTKECVVSTVLSSPTQRERASSRALVPISRTVALETSVSEARWMLWPAFGLWIAFVAAGIMFG